MNQSIPSMKEIATHFVKLYIDDTKNAGSLRKYAEELCCWLQREDATHKNIFDKCPEYGVFLLETMERYMRELYPTLDLKFRMDAEDILTSLQLQQKKHTEREILMRQRTMMCIFDSGYRGYD